MIPPFLHTHLPTIKSYCLKYGVKELWVFGSVLTKEFSPNSDIDFLYEFDEKKLSPQEELSSLLGLIDSLQKRLNRKVDMVWLGGIKNPYFRAEIDRTKQLVYAQESPKVPV